MTKEILLRTCMFIIILFVLCLNPVWVAVAEDCKDCQEETGGIGIPTSAGNTEYPVGWECECNSATPTIIASSETIVSGGSITLWVDSGDLACPPYTWSTTSEGYSLSAAETDDDLETVTLSLINTTGKTCGTGGSGDYDVYATVKVMDTCGKTDEIAMRYSGGTWKEDVSKAITGCNINSTCSGYAYVNGGTSRWKVTVQYVFSFNGSNGECPNQSQCLPSNGCNNWAVANWNLFTEALNDSTPGCCGYGDPICCWNPWKSYCDLSAGVDYNSPHACTSNMRRIVIKEIRYYNWSCP